MKCKNCGAELEQRQHKFLKEKMLKQPFFYLRWYKCYNCKKQFNLEEDKIFNNTKHYKPKKVKEKSPGQLYWEETQKHLKSINKNSNNK